MKRGRRTMMLLGVILAVLAFFVMYLGLSGSTTRGGPLPTPTVEPKAQVLVAAKDIPSYTVIKPEDVAIKEVNVSQVVSGTTADPTGVVGQVLIKAYTADSQIVMDDVSPPGISQVLAKGERGFVLAIKEVNNFGGQLVDGDAVDVLWTRIFEITTSLVGPDGKSTQITKSLPTTKKLLDNIKILRVIHLTAGPAAKKSGAAVNTTPQTSNDAAAAQAAQTAAQQAEYGDTADTAPTAALILAITDQQAEVIKYARETGTIDLALRAKDDAEVQRTTGVTDKILIEDYGVQIPELIVK